MAVSFWGKLVVDSLRRPRQAARQLLAIAVPDRTVIEGAVLVSAAGMVLAHAVLSLVPEADVVGAGVLHEPLVSALVQLVAIFFLILLVVRIGRLFGGQGQFHDAAKLIVWLDLVLVMMQAVQLALLFVFPALAALVSLIAVAWMLWAFGSFVAELHGFKNVAIVLGVSILSAIFLSFAVAMLLSLLGLSTNEVP